MNLDPLSFALSQINYLIANLNKKNFKSSQTEIAALIETNGIEAERHLFRCLVSSIDFNSDTKASGKDLHQSQLFKECLIASLGKPNFGSILCFAVDSPLQFQESLKLPSNLASQISKLYKLTHLQEIAVAIVLQNCAKEDIKKSSKEFLRQKLADLNDQYSDLNKELNNLDQTSVELVQQILLEIKNSNGPQSPEYTELVSKLKKELSNLPPAVLEPFFNTEKNLSYKESHIEDAINQEITLKMDFSIVDTIQELGYSFTTSQDDCASALLSISSSIKDQLTPALIARLLGMMAKTHNILQGEGGNDWSENNKDTWNTETFVLTVQEMVPNFAWKEVVKEFDYPEFFLKDKMSLRLIVQALKKVLKDPFPIDYLYRIWKNTEGQFSWILQSLKHPDVFCFADYPCRRTATECLKAQPEDDNRTVASWRSLSLLELLLGLSETGIYSSCIELFKTPIHNCPDLLLLGLLQLTNVWNKLKQELIAALVSLFLGNHPNSAVILQHAWNQQVNSVAIRTLMMSAMTEWYMKVTDNEQNLRLARILDVSQDLKALSLLLNGQPLIFNIDLACLAARRGYLKLDKWLSDRIRDHGELFIATVVAFLRRKVPQLANPSTLTKEEQMNMRPIMQNTLLPETVQTILKCISSPGINVSTEVSAEIIQMSMQARFIFEKLQPTPAGLPQTPLAPSQTQTPSQLKPNPLSNPALAGAGNQGTLEMIQNMMNTLNMANPNQQQPITFNSPNKLMQVNPAIQNALSSINSQNILSNNLDQSKINVLNTMFTNRMRALQSPQINPNNPLTANEALLANMSEANFSKEIEEEVEKCIQRVFKPNLPNSLSVDEFAEILGKMKDSMEKKEKEFYNYALKYIIDTNCIVALDDMQFSIMANIWGVLIDRNILSNQVLVTCLRLLLQMITKSTNPRFFLFCCRVLDRCKNRLKDLTNFCQYAVQLPNYPEIPRPLRDYIEYGARGALPPSAMNPALNLPQLNLHLNAAAAMKGNFINAGLGANVASQMNILANQMNLGSNLIGGGGSAGGAACSTASALNSSHGRSMSKPSIANTTNIDTLLVANENDANSKPTAPSEAAQDKIGFIFNNLSLSNMQIKGDELKDVLKEEYWEWLAHYLVVKRVSIEPNFHMLYSQFIDTLKKETLTESILAETYRNIKVLLRSDKNDQKFCDRALLKNLGSWLGLITLAKNRPILHKDIDLKSLIIEAFQKGQAELLFVVPFVAKVLESAGKSKIFQPPNPWLWSMLSVLVELHNEPDLKLNHKFEIEVLCKNLNLSINDIPVKLCLRSYEIYEEQLTKLKETPSSAASQQVDPSGAGSIQAPSLVNQPSLVHHMGTSGIMPPSALQASASMHPSQVVDSSILAAAGAGAEHALQMQANGAAGAGTFVAQTPKYKISDIKLQSLQNNANLIQINPDIPLLAAQPVLKNLIIPALDKAVSDMMNLLLDKAVKISVSTAESIIKKDFALDPEENHMRIAARNTVANMSSGMMLITGKEPLTSYLFNTLKNTFQQPLEPSMALAFKDMINQACTVIVQDNIELCMCFLQKIAIQRSIMELDKKLMADFENRVRARGEGRQHFDPNVLNYHTEKMPEMIRLRVGSLSPQQFSVYEEFGKNLPGFKINVEERAQTNFSQAVDEMNIHYENVILALRNEIGIMPNTHYLTINVQGLAQAVHDFKQAQQPNNAYNLVKKLVYNVLEGGCASSSVNDANSGGQSNQQPMSTNDPLLVKYRDCNMNVLKVILNDPRFCNNNWIIKEVQKLWLECTQDFKYSIDGMAILFKYKLLNYQTVDTTLAQAIDSGNNVKAIQIGMQILRYFYIENASAFSDAQFNSLMDSINKISSISRFAQLNNELKDILEVIRMNYESDDSNANGMFNMNMGLGFSHNRLCATALSMMYTGVQQARDFDDPAGLKEKSDQLLHEWIQHHSQLPQKENTKVFQQFVLQMNSQGLFKTDDMITRFFRICTELCVDSCYRYLSKGQRQQCYVRLDAFVKLIILLVKHSGDQTNHVNKINLFNKVLGLIAGCLLYDHETKSNNFEPMPFHRLFYMLLFEATLPENNLEAIIYPILQAFVNVYHIVRPSKAPGFTYSWLELVSHRLFISKMLQVPQPTPDQNYKTWNMYATLLTQLIRFMVPYLRNVELVQSITVLFKGTLRLFLVLLHDFPEFLCSCHYQFCDSIPPNCIQLRNLVLSAFPRSMKLPDPLTPNLKVDMIGEIDSKLPTIAYPYIYNIPQKLKNDLDSYLKTRSPVTFLSDLRSYLQSSPDTGSHYNIQLMNALVIYVGSNGIQALRSKGLSISLNTLTNPAHSTHSDIFQSLVVDLDSEGRYLFINAVANQLRYPNSHTHYFGCALLNLFSEANIEAIQEQITRVLLERLIVNRPHPWGLLVTFIELIKNPQFKFWNHQFVHCAPEIEKMFQSLGRNCMKASS